MQALEENEQERRKLIKRIAAQRLSQTDAIAEQCLGNFQAALGYFDVVWIQFNADIFSV
jgi:hypothetical protein